MIYYLVAYNTNSGETEYRKLITSQACINRVNNVIDVLKTLNEVIIVNCALNNAETDFDAKIEKIDENVSVYFPAISLNKNRIFEVMANCTDFLKKNLKEGDLLLCYNAHYLSSMIVSNVLRKCNVKLIYQVEELYSSSSYYGLLKKSILRYSEKMMSKKCTASLVVNKKLINKYLKDKPCVISYGYLVRSKKMLPTMEQQDLYSIVYSGRLDEDGGVEIFLDSLAYIDFPCKVTVTGGGILSEKVSRYVSPNNNVNFEYKGFVSQSELDTILSNADICISTLRTDRAFSQYSFPSKVYQYLSYGGKVVSSNLDSLSELRQCFDNLFVYNENNAINIANAIKQAREFKCGNRESNIVRFKSFFNKKEQELKLLFCKIIDGK